MIVVVTSRGAALENKWCQLPCTRGAVIMPKRPEASRGKIPQCVNETLAKTA